MAELKCKKKKKKNRPESARIKSHKKYRLIKKIKCHINNSIQFTWIFKQ